jgi:hypothetical protein
MEGIYKIIEVPSWMAWVQRPSVLIKKEGSSSAFYSRGCFMEANIKIQSKSLLDLMRATYFATALNYNHKSDNLSP